MPVENIFSGPGIFIWGVDDTGADEVDAVTFDLTQGGIRFTTTTTWNETTVDQYGNVPVRKTSTGTTGLVEFQAAEVDYEKVVKFDPSVVKVADTLEPTKVKYQVTALAGKTLPRKRAVIKPQGVTDPNMFIYLEECSVEFDADFGYRTDDNLKMPVRVPCFPALDATPKGLLYTWGDITATA
ncbi:hypothetical protein [Schinkia azotoformans]|uniref:hypothetical protein n=1 Tax=Schinkia azotoformans TaxID=1454 RepID=UPI002DB9A260|nr:hypothetical protein [Schinkia azotoformans]MEC1714762.1 hypothetical protein [Schinkia azotoformans]MEC1757482.1 hypothetical protein [Schinkia azotoformans]